MKRTKEFDEWIIKYVPTDCRDEAIKELENLTYNKRNENESN